MFLGERLRLQRLSWRNKFHIFFTISSPSYAGHEKSTSYFFSFRAKRGISLRVSAWGEPERFLTSFGITKICGAAFSATQDGHGRAESGQNPHIQGIVVREIQLQ